MKKNEEKKKFVGEPKRGFKAKTIEQTIDNKMKSWIKSIDDENLRKEVAKHYIVTGGAIASMLLGYLPNDFDVYFDNKATARKVAEYYLKTSKENNKSSYVGKIEVKDSLDGNGLSIFIKSAGVIRGEEDTLDDYRYFESLPPDEAAKYLTNEIGKSKKNYSVAMISSNAISLLGDVQIIMRFVGDPKTIHEFYDFAHCTNYYTPSTGLILNPKALEALLAKELKYVGSKYPICSLFRLKKFIKRGFTITAGEILKISFDINKLDLTDYNVLMDQLVGVDAAYFWQVLTKLREDGHLKEDGGLELDRTYLFELINRVFDEYDGTAEAESHEYSDNADDE